MAAPVALLAVFAAVPHGVASRAATGSRLVAAVVGTPVFRSHCVSINISQKLKFHRSFFNVLDDDYYLIHFILACSSQNLNR